MTLTVLLDLDDTLLSNNINTFLPAYLKALGKHLVAYVAPDKMVRDLLLATQVMLANNAATLSLERSFDQAFYPAIGRTKAEMRPMLDQFYDSIFPGLETLTAQRPAAIQLVHSALVQGHTLVVATNPIFPRKAILHRLRWAGLDEEVQFALVTDYERFHFAKPNPAFFTEILAQLGWPNQPAVVVGNSLEDDLLPAARLGLPVFWVGDPPAPLPADAASATAKAEANAAGIFHPISASGTLGDIPAWLEKVDTANLRQEFKTPTAILAVLKSTPAALDTLSLGLSEWQWRERPEPKEWSLTEIFCHLRDVDREVNIPRLEKVMGGGNPFLAGINTDTWAEERNYRHQDGPAALREFIQVRTRLIAQLESLPETDWQRPARHAIFGPTNLQELVEFTATHDRTHIQQAMAAAGALAA